MPVKMKKSGEVRDAISSWIDDASVSSVFLVVAEQGAGKTILCQQLTKESDLIDASVVLLDLRNVTGLARRVPTRDEVIAECLARGYPSGSGFNNEAFNDLVQSGKTLIMVDGIESVLEELPVRDAAVFCRDIQRLALGAPLAKVLITCRPGTLALGEFERRDYRSVELTPYNE